MTIFRGRGLGALGVVLLALAGCGGGGGYGSSSTTMGSGTTFVATRLVSDTGGTGGGGYTSGGLLNTDAHLVNAWGVAFNPTGYVWVADGGTGLSTLYDGNGVPQSLVVTTPPDPTGIVFNGNTTDFIVASGGLQGSSAFVFATEDGLIAAWSPAVNLNATVTVFDGSAAAKSYKGLALATQAGAKQLYATDFHNGAVDVFDTHFTLLTLAGAFQDPNLPAGYAPFGIQAIGSNLYVTYAKQDAEAGDEVDGAGLGLIDVFDSAGVFVKRLVTGGALNAPWGMAQAPASGFGIFSGALLVGNFGDGKINAYDINSGALLGTLKQPDGTTIVIDGLWGIAFGNGINSQPTTTLFYTAGPGGEAHGAYGRIDVY